MQAHRWAAYVYDANGSRYVSTTVDGKTVYLHRWLLSAPDGVKVDHRDRDTLNNRRLNLRLATHRSNMQNCRVRKTSTTGVRGVEFIKSTGRYRAYCTIGATPKKHLGYFDTPEQAAAVARAARLANMPGALD